MEVCQIQSTDFSYPNYLLQLKPQGWILSVPLCYVKCINITIVHVEI